MKKCTKTGLSLILVLLMTAMSLACLGPITVSAQGKAIVEDQGDLLSSKEEKKLAKALQKVADKRDCDLAAFTTGDLEGQDAVDYIDNKMDSMGLGQDRECGAVALLVYVDTVDPSTREVRISTDVTANNYFSDDDNARVIETIKPDLSNGDYGDAFLTFADTVDQIYGEAMGEESGSRGVSPFWAFGDLGIGAAIAFLLGSFHKSRLKTSHRQRGAAAYVENDGIQFEVKEDIFLDERVERRRIETEDRSKDYDPGTTHTSSSGHKHGGAGGSF